jgi:hypothetical protein
MRLRTFYAAAFLLPLFAQAIVVPLGVGNAELATPLPAGATAEWLYPRSATREIAATSLVALWLFLELRRRSPSEFSRLLWLGPLVNVPVGVLLLAPFILVQGAARDLLSEYGGRVVLRIVVRLLVGFAYVGLLVFVREQLRQSHSLDDG